MDEAPKNKYSWWERRTRVEKCLIVACAASLIVILYLSSNLLMKFPSSSEHLKQEICLTPKCITSAAFILDKIDRKVDPCDDFYKFACGNFIRNTVIPSDEGAVSVTSQIMKKIDARFMKLYAEPVVESDTTVLKLVKSVYKSCMNVSQIEKEGLEFVKNEFKILGGWPVADPYWNEKLFDWKNVLYRLQKLGWRRSFFFSMGIYPDSKNNSKRIFTVSKTCGLSYEFLKKGLNDTWVRAMYDTSVELSVLFGADRALALSDMMEVLNFQTALAQIAEVNTTTNKTSGYNPMTVRAFQRNFTTIPWLKVINNFLAPADMLTSEDTINVAAPDFFRKFEPLMLKTKKRTLANYMFLRLISQSTDVLPEIFRKTEFKLLKVVSGRSEEIPRWKHCVQEASRLDLAVSSLYVQRFFDKSIKSKATELTLDIKLSFLDTLRKIGWMDRKTKKHAMQKAEAMRSGIAYPEEMLDDTNIEEYYKGLELDGEKYYLALTFNLSKFEHVKNVKKLREAVRKDDWTSFPYAFAVNAFYLQPYNRIEIPAAMLNERFFDPLRPQYMNYGAIGEVMGHETTHGFDDQGRQFDKDGNLVDWWEPETNRTFARKAQCLVEQYGNYTVPEIETSVDGQSTLGENIADNGGIKIAYKAYLRWLDRHRTEPALPGLPYTPKQMFWISSAVNWCKKYTKEMLKQTVSMGNHAPHYFRVVVPFMNSDYFGRDFNCPLGSPMNPKYKCRVW